MLRIVLRDKKGVTLVEVLIALTVLLIVFLGLIQTSIVVIQSNMKNLLRDEAVTITSDWMSRLRARNYDDLDNTPPVPDASPLDFTIAAADTTRNYRSGITVPFSVAVNAVALDGNNKQITITTTWAWQGEPFQHQIMTTRQR